MFIIVKRSTLKELQEAVCAQNYRHDYEPVGGIIEIKEIPNLICHGYAQGMFRK